MAKQNTSLSDWNKQGWVEKDGKLVKSDTLVEKNVPKINPFNMILPDGDGKMYYPNSLIEVPEKYFLEKFELPNGETIRIKYRFNLSPLPAPRMTQSDKWRNPRRACVQRYFDWREAFTALCKINGYTLQETLRVLFIMPLPKHLSKAKKKARLGQPHKQRGDVDNLTKSILDAFGIEDGYVYDIRAIKIWGISGSIIIF